MKLVKGQASGYRMPSHSHIALVSAFTDGDPKTNPRSYRRLIPRVELHEIFQMREQAGKLPGMPTAMAVTWDSLKGYTLEFFPIPDKDYEILIRYAGPLQEI